MRCLPHPSIPIVIIPPVATAAGVTTAATAASVTPAVAAQLLTVPRDRLAGIVAAGGSSGSSAAISSRRPGSSDTVLHRGATVLPHTSSSSSTIAVAAGCRVARLRCCCGSSGGWVDVAEAAAGGSSGSSARAIEVMQRAQATRAARTAVTSRTYSRQQQDRQQLDQKATSCGCGARGSALPHAPFRHTPSHPPTNTLVAPYPFQTSQSVCTPSKQLSHLPSSHLPAYLPRLRHDWLQQHPSRQQHQGLVGGRKCCCHCCQRARQRHGKGVQGQPHSGSPQHGLQH